MIQTPQPITKSTPAPQASGQRCVCCGTPLTRPGTVIPGLGVFGPKCAQRVQRVVSDLQQGVLAELLCGPVRLAMPRAVNGDSLLPPSSAPYFAAAKQLGIRLTHRAVGREYVLTLVASGLPKTRKGAQA
jgi:hypothetical protein